VELRQLGVGRAHLRDVRGNSTADDARRRPWRTARRIDRTALPAGPVARLVARAACRAGSIAFFAALPLMTLSMLVADWNHRGIVAVDFRQFYGAAQTILAGANPYPSGTAAVEPWAHEFGYPYPYPPLPALMTIPLTALPRSSAEVVVTAGSIAVLLLIPFVLGVRDWRCYGLLLLWPPSLLAIQTSNPTLVLALAAALAWRFRERPVRVGSMVGLTLAVKFFLWPLLIWFVASRRLISSVVALTVGALLLILSWAAIGFAGFVTYPALLRATEERWGPEAYTLRNAALDFGVSSTLATVAWLATGLTLLFAAAALGRRGDDRRAFALALAAAFALSPLVWLEYFVFLVVVVAIAQPRVGFAWFMPLAMFVSTSNDQPTPFVLCWTLGVAALTLAVALGLSPARTRISQSPALPRAERLAATITHSNA
jgi:hypothetical protein